jgi:hypothetical protein
MRRLLCVFVALLALPSARADALTIRDVVELTRAGLGEEVLLALIEVDPSVFPIDTATLKDLKEAGVSQRVIIAMVRSARTPPPVAQDPVIAQMPPQPPEPQVVVIDHRDERVREVPVVVPVYIPVVQRSRIPRHVGRIDGDHTFPNDRRPRDPFTESDHHPSKPAQPVYWGTAGTLRPDAWKPNRPAQAGGGPSKDGERRP